MSALKIQGNIWMLTGGGFNSVVSIGDDGILVVDAQNRILDLNKAVRRIFGIEGQAIGRTAPELIDGGQYFRLETPGFVAEHPERRLGKVFAR